MRFYLKLYSNFQSGETNMKLHEALSQLVKTKFGGRDGLMIVFPTWKFGAVGGISDIRVVNRPQAFVMTNI